MDRPACRGAVVGFGIRVRCWGQLNPCPPGHRAGGADRQRPSGTQIGLKIENACRSGRLLICSAPFGQFSRRQTSGGDLVFVLFPSARSHNRTDADLNAPRPETIRRATAAIRKHWSLKTRLSRTCEVAHPITVTEMPSVPTRKGYRVDLTWG